MTLLPKRPSITIPRSRHKPPLPGPHPSSSLPCFIYHHACCALSLSRPTFCNPMNCSPPGSSVHGTLQAKILEWVAMHSSRVSSQPRDQRQVSSVTGGFLTEKPGKPVNHHSSSHLTCLLFASLPLLAQSQMTVGTVFCSLLSPAPRLVSGT